MMMTTTYDDDDEAVLPGLQKMSFKVTDVKVKDQGHPYYITYLENMICNHQIFQYG